MVKKTFFRLFFCVLGVGFLTGNFAHASFEKDAMAYVRQDITSGDLRLLWEYPDRVARLPVGIKITSYKNIGQNRVQFTLEGEQDPVSARLDFWMEVPMLKTPSAKGSILEEDNIVMQKVSLLSLAPDVIVKKEDLVGKAPKSKILQAMQTIQSSDLITPFVVKRGDTVTVIYRTPALVLTTKAKALKDGVVGEILTFEVKKQKNGNKHIEAVIVDQDKAEVKVTQVT